MSQCPKCGTSVDHDFGVVACSGCGVILFIDLDGNLQLSGDTSASAETEASGFEAPAPIEDASSAFAAPSYEQPVESEAAPTEEAGISPVQFDYANEETPAEETAFETPAAVEESAPVGNSDFNMDSFDAPEAPPSTPDQQIREVADFGNSPSEEGHALQYTIRIEGIDSKETRDRMFELLTDVRLGLSVRELQTQVVRGTLEIPQLNPVRASVIVGKLRELPLKLNWRQDVWKSS